MGVQFNPPLTVLTIPEGPPPYPQSFLTAVQAALLIPGINPLVKVCHADAYAGNFENILACSTALNAGALLHVNIAGVPIPPDASSRYNILTLPIVGAGSQPPAQLAIPIPGQPAFAGPNGEFVQSFKNLKTFLTSKGWLGQLFKIGFCPWCREENDGEAQLPSTNGKPLNQDFTSNWLAATNLTSADAFDALMLADLETIAAGIAQVFPGIPCDYAFLVSSSQRLGFLPDKQNVFSGQIIDGIIAAAAQYGGLINSIQQSYTIGQPATNFALSKGLQYGRLGLQMVPNYSTQGDIISCLDSGLGAFGSILNEFQIHTNQATIAAAYMTARSLPHPPVISFPGLTNRGGILSFPGAGIVASG